MKFYCAVWVGLCLFSWFYSPQTNLNTRSLKKIIFGQTFFIFGNANLLILLDFHDLSSQILPPNQQGALIYRVSQNTGNPQYELTLSAWRLLSTWDRCQKFDILGTFWYLAFKITKTSFLQNWGIWKNIRFSNLGGNTKENIINLLGWFNFCSHF